MRVGGGRWGGPLLVALVLLVISPGQALAARPPDTYTVPAGSLVFGLMPGSNGYRIHFSEWQRQGSPPRFKAVVEGHHATVTYAVPAGRRLTPGVTAGLGRRGRFDLRLTHLGKARRLGIPHYCGGEPGHWRRGYAVGLARFHGERGYTSTDGRTRRIPIVVESWPAFRCHYLEGEPRGKPRRAQVNAHRGTVSFGALLSPPHVGPADERVSFWASQFSGRGRRISISREVKVLAPESAFTFPGGPKLPEEVTVEPPYPFAGSASFVRRPESTFTWSGDLTVQFPGLAPIRLAGPGFRAGVCALDGCVSREPEREPPFRPAAKQ